jgi:hypothetical protein
MARTAGPAGDRYLLLHQRQSAVTGPVARWAAGMPGRLAEIEVARKLIQPEAWSSRAAT